MIVVGTATPTNIFSSASYTRCQTDSVKKGAAKFTTVIAIGVSQQYDSVAVFSALQSHHSLDGVNLHI